MCAVAVVVHRIRKTFNRAKAILVVNRAQFVVVIGFHARRAYPHVLDQIFVSVIDTAIEHGDNKVFTACCLGPSKGGADVCPLLAATLSGIRECPLIGELRIVRKNRIERTCLIK